jgi:hypothetical protein
MFGAQGRTAHEGQGGREQLHCLLPLAFVYIETVPLHLRV